MSVFFLAVAVVGGLVWLALLLDHPRTRVPLLYGTGIVLITSSAGVLSHPLFAVAGRPAGVALIALAALSSPVDDAVGSPRLAGRWASALCGPLATYVVVTTAPHGEWRELVLYLAAVCLPLLLIVATGGHLAVVDLVRGLTLGLWLTVGGSLVYGVVRPDLAIESDRLRGLLENANSLGFIAFVLGAVAILVPTRWSSASLALSVVALVWTASRASTLALIVVGLLELVRRKRYGVVAALAVAVGLGALLLSRLDLAGSPLDVLLRTNDSRSGSVDAALADVSSSPLWGIGLNNETAIIASSPFRALSNGGVLGILCVAVQGVLMLRTSLVTPQALIVVTAGLVHSMFEGWVLSPSSPFLLVFAAAWLLIAQVTPRPPATLSDVDPDRPVPVGRWAR